MSNRITFSTTAAVRRQLRERAAADGRSVSKYLTRLVERDVALPQSVRIETLPYTGGKPIAQPFVAPAVSTVPSAEAAAEVTT